MTGSEGISVASLSESLSSEKASGIIPPKNKNSKAVNKIKWSHDGRRLAVASGDSIYMLAMSDEIWKPIGDEEVRLMSNLRSRGFLNEDE